MNAGVAALTISLLDNPTGRRGHFSSSRADPRLWNASDTIAMPPRFATTFDSKLVAVGGAMGGSRCQAPGASWAWALGVKLCFSFFSLTMGRGLVAFGPNENSPVSPTGNLTFSGS